MSDLLAPLLYVLDDEVDAFWCFVAYMERVVSHCTKRLITSAALILSSNHCRVEFKLPARPGWH